MAAMATSRLGLGLSKTSHRAFPPPSTFSNLGCSRFSVPRGRVARPYSGSPGVQTFGSSASRSTAYFLAGGAGASAVGLVSFLSAPHRSPVLCEPATASDYRPYASGSKRTTVNEGEEVPPPSGEVDSIVSISHLSFGTVTGFCAGVFVKKGLMIVAFFLGGGFVLLQYLHSRALITINWPGFARSYESVIARRTAQQRGDSRLAKVANGLWDFLTADFQGRATFAAGFVLGARMG